MSDDPDSWRNDRSIMDWVGLFFAEMGWALQEMQQGVPDEVLEDLDVDKQSLKDRIAAAALIIPADGSLQSAGLGETRGALDEEVDAVSSPLSLANATDGVGAFEAAVQRAAGAVPPAPFDPLARKAQARQALMAIMISAAFLPDKRRAFAAEKKAIAARIEGATDKGAFDTLDVEIATLAKAVADQAGVVTARAAADQAVADARAKFDGVAGDLDRGGFVHLEAQYAALVGIWHQAGSEAAFKTVKTKADDFVALAEKAETFGRFYTNWFDTSVALIGTSVAEVHRDDAISDRRAALDAAIAFSQVGDFKGAETALRAFAPVGVAASTDAKNISDFLAKLAACEANCSKDLAVISASWLKNSSEKDNAFKTIRKVALSTPDYAGQSAKLDTLEVWIKGNLPLAKEISKHQQGMKSSPAFRQIIADMEALRGLGDWGGALAKLKEIGDDAALAAQSASLTYDKTMEKRYTALSKSLPKPERQALKAAWTKHTDAVSAGEVDTAKAALVELRKLFVLEDLLALRAQEKKLSDKTPKIKDYKYLEQYRGFGRAGEYIKAKAEIERVLLLLPVLAEYISRREHARSLLLALPDDPPELRSTLNAALDAADIKAQKGDPATALADLNTTLSGTDYEGLSLEIADFGRRAEKVDRQQAKVLKFMELAAPKAKLEELLDAAKAVAFPAFKFDEAFDKLNDHSALLVTAMHYATTRRQAKGIKNALARAVAQSGQDEADLFAGGKLLSEIQTAFDSADEKAKRAQFDSAQKSYAALMADCQSMTAQAVNYYELADAADDCNAGHSIGRHGPQLTDGQLIERLKSGKAADWSPGKKLSFTGASSKFKSMEDWLAGREMGAALAKEKNGVDVGALKLGKDPDTGAFIEPVAQKFVIDHGRPIDEAFIGRKKNVSYIADTGEIKEERTYETYEALTGISKARVNFTWEFKKIAGAKPSSVADYINKYKAANAGAAPVDIEGRWVMMQQFPECDGWDQELQTYVLRDEEVA